MARPRKDATILSKGSVLRAASDLIREGGEGAATFRALAKVLGVTPMAASYHVGSREQLLRDLIVQAFRGLDADVEGDTAACRLRALMQRYFRMAQDHIGLVTVILRDPSLMSDELVGFTKRVRVETQVLNDGDAEDVLLNLVIDYAHGFIFSVTSAPVGSDLGEDDFLRSLDWVLGKVEARGV